MNNYPQIAALLQQGIDKELVCTLSGADAKTIDLVSHNMNLEDEMCILGAERYRERQEALESRGNEFETDVKMAKVNKMLKPFKNAIEAYVVENVSKRHKGIVYDVFKNNAADELALLTIRNVITSITHEQNNLTSMSTNLAKYIDDSLSTADKIKVGIKLITLCCEHSNGCFVKTKHRQGGNMVHCVESTEDFLEWEEKYRELMATLSVIRRPMVVPPQPWTSISKGGYWSDKLQEKLIRNNPKATNKTHGVKVMPRVYEAVNKIQATPFTINQFVLDVAKAIYGDCEAYLEDVERDYNNIPDCFFPKFIQALPERPVSGRIKTYQKQQAKLEEQLGITQEKRTEQGKKFGQWVRDLLAKILPDSKEAKLKAELEEVRYNIMVLFKWQKEMVSKKSKNRVITTALEVAEDYRDYPALYFPANLDWRGRVYPMCAGLTTQGNCLQKALIKFAAGKPIGTEEAAYWLMVHTANCYGQDKDSWQDRLEWTLANEDLIKRVAADPIGTLEEWRNTDAPWLFIAACEQMQKYYDHGLDAVVDISIPMDGTCNGAQHYSAMSRDTHGAYQVNVAPNGTQGLRERLAELRKDKTDSVRFDQWTKPYLTVEVNRLLKSLIGE